jgi:hypothetical protein
MAFAASADDSLSAGELRQRYRAAPDDALSASQLRARNNMAGNKWARDEPLGAAQLLLYAVVAVVLLLSAAVALQAL